MFGIFSKTAAPSIDEVNKHIQFYNSLFADTKTSPPTILLPTAKYFPEQKGKKDRELVEYYTKIICRQFSLKSAIRIIPDKTLNNINIARKLPIIHKNNSRPSSFIRKNKNGYEIHYAPSLLKNPGVLVAELSLHVCQIFCEINMAEKELTPSFLEYICIAYGLGVFIINMDNSFRSFNRSEALRWHSKVEQSMEENTTSGASDSEETSFNHFILIAIHLKKSSSDTKEIAPFIEKRQFKFIAATSKLIET